MNPYFHEFDVIRYVYNVLASGDVFVDVGAMGGLYTIIASKRVGPHGKVLAIEPNSEVYRVLKEHVELNNLENVVLENCAVGEDYRPVSLRFDEGYEELASIDESRGDVKMVPLDALVSNFEFIKVLKVDTEGYDEKVIISSGDSLQKTCVVVSEMNTET